MDGRVMMARRSVLGLIVGAGFVALTGCDRLKNTTIGGDYLPNYRYRLSVDVHTPEGLRSGSSVIEVIKSWRRGATVRGQAVTVDLPGEQTLFVLLRSENMSDWASKAMVPAWPDSDDLGDEGKNIAELLRVTKAKGRIPLPRRWQLTGPDNTMDHTPYFVRFRNIADPASVEQVDPDNLAKSFGPGIKLKGIFVEITDDPVTTGIERRLAWLPNIKGKYLDGRTVHSSQELANVLGSGDFLIAGNN